MEQSSTNFFKTRRDELSLTQRQIAERMGITPQAISNWERGETLPHAEDYSAVAAAYEVAPEVLALEVMRLAQASAA